MQNALNCTWPAWLRHRYITKTMLVMKLPAILFMAGFLNVCATGVSQNVSFSGKNVPLETVFSEVKKQTGFVFLCSQSVLADTKPVTIDVSNVPLSSFLDLAFKDQPIQYRIRSRSVFVFVKPVGGHTGRQFNLAGKDNLEDTVNNVRGRVIDEKGKPLANVSVTIKGTSNGTPTDAEGKFKINVPDKNTTLVFSSIGFVTKELPVITDGEMTVRLTRYQNNLQDVVVIGYGTQKREDVIGSISTIKSGDITSTRASTLEGALQGRASGLQITPSSGVPGAPLKVLIRGLSTISSSSDPLWVVDGTPTSDISNINPNDIASIEVLKDAGATAVFGSRGANGVILITTKTARPNEKISSINVSTGISQMTRNARDMGIANTAQFFQLLDMGTQNVGSPAFNGSLSNLMDHPLGNSKGYKPLTRTQAQAIDNNPDAFFRRGNYTDVNVSSALGLEKTAVFFSLNYRNDNGLEKDNGMNRISLRLNFDYEPVKNVKIGTKINLSYLKNDIGSNQFATLMGYRQSWYPIYDSTDPTGYWNPYSGYAATQMRTESQYHDNTTTTYRGFISNYVQYNIPFVKGLVIRANANVDQRFFSARNWTSADISLLNMASDAESTNQAADYLTNIYLNYNRDFGAHRVSFTAGAERQSVKDYTYNLAGQGLSSPYHELGSLPAVTTTMQAYENYERYIGSYFSRFGYNYKRKYYIEGSIRRDGSSAFDESHRYGLFPSLSLGWLVSDEPFFQKASSVINLAKIRGSVGRTGNQSIPSNVSTQNWQYSGNYGGVSNQGTSGLVPSNIPNIDATWETTTSYDGGLDFGLFKNRITGSLAYYAKDVTGLLLAINVPSSSGALNNVIWKNVGRMVTKGVEVDLQSTNINSNGFRWTSTFNFTSTHNRVKVLNPDIDAKGTGIAEIENSNGLQNAGTYLKAGDPVGEYYMAESAGVNAANGYPQIYELDQTKYATAGQTMRTGKIIPATVDNLRNNRFILQGKTGLPTFFGSFGNNFEYKGFSLDLLFTYAGGNYLYNDFNVMMTQPGSFWGPLSSKLLTQAWTKPGDNARYGQVRYGGSYNFDDNGNPGVGGTWGETQDASSRYLEKGDFIRLKNLRFAYNIPKQRYSKIGVRSLMVYFAATNLLTFTSYSGWDPEIVRIDPTGDNRAQNMLGGFTGIIMPNLKTYSVGFSMGF